LEMNENKKKTGPTSGMLYEKLMKNTRNESRNIVTCYELNVIIKWGLQWQ
jgi:hypothetical protein